MSEAASLHFAAAAAGWVSFVSPTVGLTGFVVGSVQVVRFASSVDAWPLGSAFSSAAFAAVAFAVASATAGLKLLSCFGSLATER